ncbi:MAG: ParA family protein [Rickettsiales bacterium]
MRNLDARFNFNMSQMAYLLDMDKSRVSRFISENKIEAAEIYSNRRKKFSIDTMRAIGAHKFESFKPIKEKINVFYNFKGGTGKTSICNQVSFHLCLLGFNVLVIDTDAQAHLTKSVGFDEYNDFDTLYDVLVNNVDLKSTIHKVYPGFDFIPSNLSMTKIDPQLSTRNNREKILRKQLEQVRDEYDYIIIDTNPTISVLNFNAAFAAERLNIVCETQPYSLQGLDMLITELTKFSKDMEYKDINYGIIPNKYESKVVTSQEALGKIRADYKEKSMESVIRRSEEMNISAKEAVPVQVSAKIPSPAVEDIKDLTFELIEKTSGKQIEGIK